MNEMFKDVTSVLMAVVGVAILAVLVSQRNQTAQVVSTASSGFANILGVAMGGASNAMPSISALA